ncbi:hypothetical protein EVAR_103278_1 [Eumeta japonica]|uniref:Uncharacterized protein n=1 Tax=Eumeta variegata TaxID=151549 RepID=A0A4C1XN79_EUMVA|nr:hypothetical protein EVAR_103278_1 [Eumeta japonica]
MKYALMIVASAFWATVSAIPPPHPRVLEAKEEERFLPDHLRSPAWRNPHLRQVLPLTSLLHNGEKLVYDRDTDEIDRGEIYKMLTHAGLVPRRPNTFDLHRSHPKKIKHESNDHLPLLDSPELFQWFWLILVILSWYGSAVLIVSAWEDFCNNPISFGVDSSYIDWDTDFPSVGIVDARPFSGFGRSINGDSLFSRQNHLHSPSVPQLVERMHCLQNNFSYYANLVTSKCHESITNCSYNGLLANRHLVKLGLIKSERKRCPLLTTPPHCKKSADHRKKRAHREERQSGVRAYAAIAEIAVTAGPSSRIILNKFTSKSCASDFYFRVHASDSERVT